MEAPVITQSHYIFFVMYLCICLHLSVSTPGSLLAFEMFNEPRLSKSGLSLGKSINEKAFRR